jgi:Leucine-rich repeat (LRR) protein
VLATLPNLKYLDLTKNKIKVLFNDIQDMSNWRERVIQLILPSQVAALNLGEKLPGTPENFGVPFQQELTVDDHSTVEINNSNSVHSHISHQLQSKNSLDMGFLNLETLILDQNPLGIATPAIFWGVLAALPS